MGLFNSQFSRWLITFTLGTIILGKTSLPTLLLTIVNIFPAAISNLYFPRIIENYENNAKNNTSLRLYTFILVSYFLFVIIGVILFAKLIVSFLLPNHIESLDLVYAILPALFFYNLSSPAILLFNAKKKFKNIFVGSLILMLSYFVFLIYYITFCNPNLLGFYIIESICSFIFFTYNIIEFFKIIKTKII
jgi:O-antigen/teichoic acid export membrane protein